MKSALILTIAIVVLAVAAGALIYFDSVAAQSNDVAAEFSRLENSGNQTAQDWLQLARDARSMDELGIARQSLDKASAYGLSARSPASKRHASWWPLVIPRAR